MNFTKLRLSGVFFTITALLLFLASLNFVEKFFYFFVAFALLMGYLAKKINVNKTSYLYLIFSLYIFTYHFSNDYMLAIRACVYPLAYLIGANLHKINQNFGVAFENKVFDVQNLAYKYLVIIACGTYFHYILNFFNNYGKYIGRNTVDVWSGNVMAATGQSALACIILGLSVAFIIFPQKVYQRYMGLTIVASVFVYNLTLATRTIVGIFLVVACLGSLFLLVKHYKYRIRKTTILYGAVIFTLTLLILCVLPEDVMMRNSNFFHRFNNADLVSVLDSGRIKLKSAHLSNIFTYPFGGQYSFSQVGYAHDIILDTYDEFGVIPTTMLLFIIITGAIELYKYCINNTNVLFYRVCFFCVYVAMLLVFTLEPVLQGMRWLFVVYCFINGELVCLNKINQL